MVVSGWLEYGVRREVSSVSTESVGVRSLVEVSVDAKLQLTVELLCQDECGS